MKREQIIEMARASKASSYAHRSDPQRAFYTFSPEQLAEFAQLAADHALEEAAALCEAKAKKCALIIPSDLLKSSAADIRAMKGKP